MDKTKLGLVLGFIATFSLLGLMVYCIVEILIINILIGIISLIITITLFIIMYYIIKRDNKRNKDIYDKLFKENN